MAAGNQCFLLPGICLESFRALSREAAGELVLAAMALQAGEDLPDFETPEARLIWPFIQKDIVCLVESREKKRANAEKRWSKTLQNDANCMQSDAIRIQSDANCMQNDAKQEQEQEQEQEYITPPNPLTGGEGAKVKPDRSAMARKKKVAMYFLCRIFRRRPSTGWSDKELRELRKVCQRPEFAKELWEIRRYYRAGGDYLRRDIITLLRNWPGELDRAANARKTVTLYPVRRPFNAADPDTWQYGETEAERNARIMAEIMER